MKHTTKVFIVLSIILSSTSALAERSEVFRWQALDGKAAQLASSAMRCSSVGVFQMDVACFDYVLVSSVPRLSGEEFSAFFAKAGADPSDSTICPSTTSML